LRAARMGVEWRAVEARPLLPVGGPRDAAELREPARQCGEVGGVLVAGEEVPGVVPGFVASTQAAVSA
jgi:hypothetical protein